MTTMTSNHNNLTVHWMDVNPEDARHYLERSTNVRKVSQKRVAMLAHEMRNGDWDSNGETIKFDLNGNLVDGQHRLHAIIESGRTLRLLAVKGLPPHTVTTIDTGQTRSAGQILSANFSNVKDGGIAVAALRIIRLIETGNPNSLYTPMSPSEVVNEFSHIDARCWEMAVEETSGVRQRGLLRGCVYSFAKRDFDTAVKFAVDYRTGANLDVGDPVYKLRSVFADSRLNLSRRGRVTQVALTIKAWNARRRGQPWPRILSWRNTVEVFPEVV